MLHISHALDTVFLFSTIYMCIYEFLQLETIIIMCSCWFTNLLYGLPCKSLSLRRDSVPFAYNAICLFFDCHFARLWISVLLPCVCVCVRFFIVFCSSVAHIHIQRNQVATWDGVEKLLVNGTPTQREEKEKK